MKKIIIVLLLLGMTSTIPARQQTRSIIEGELVVSQLLVLHCRPDETVKCIMSVAPPE